MFSLICVWINGWVNNREAGDLRRHRAHFRPLWRHRNAYNKRLFMWDTNPQRSTWVPFLCPVYHMDYLHGLSVLCLVTEIWGLWCLKQVSHAWLNNCISRYYVGCNYLSMHQIPASDTKVRISSVPSRRMSTNHIFTLILQGCFSGSEAMIILVWCQWKFRRKMVNPTGIITVTSQWTSQCLKSPAIWLFYTRKYGQWIHWRCEFLNFK